MREQKHWKRSEFQEEEKKKKEKSTTLNYDNQQWIKKSISIQSHDASNNICRLSTDPIYSIHSIYWLNGKIPICKSQQKIMENKN